MIKPTEHGAYEALWRRIVLEKLWPGATVDAPLTREAVARYSFELLSGTDSWHVEFAFVAIVGHLAQPDADERVALALKRAVLSERRLTRV